MTTLPAFARRGFRDWEGVGADLAAIAAAAPPGNRASVGGVIRDRGAVTAHGALSSELASGQLMVLVDGAVAAEIPRRLFRGAWLWLRNGEYHLDLDVGVGGSIQISGPR